MSHGIDVSLVNINTSDFGYKPDIKNNRILYGLKALSNINKETIESIKAGRPYQGIKDFMMRCPLKKTAMISLIKAGAFDEVETAFKSREDIMAYYIMNNCEMKKKLTMSNFNGLLQSNLVPKDLTLEIRIFNFNKYLKANRKCGQYYTFDSECIQFFNNYLSEFAEEIEVINGVTCILQKKWEKIYKSFQEIVKTKWLIPYHDEILKEFNVLLFKEAWNKYAAGSTSAWEMQAMCFYHGKHELANVNMFRYGITDYFSLPEVPAVETYFKKGNKQIPIFKLYRIAGTVLAKNDNKSSVSLLTTTGVVDVKMSREQYAKFKKQISNINPVTGKKTVVEKGWFTRGTKLVFTGFRRESQFVVKTYAKTEGHQLYKITDVIGSEIKLQHERVMPSGGFEEDEMEEVE